MMNMWTITVGTAATAALILSSTMAAVSIKAPGRDELRKVSSMIATSSSSSSSSFLSAATGTIETTQVVDASFSCTVSDVTYDTCEYQVDNVCDAGSYCPAYTDCIDCDPCRALHGTSCSSCTSDPSCSYCEGIDAFTQTAFAVCTTVELAAVIPDYCWLVSGNTGIFDGFTFAFGTSTCTDEGNGESDTCDLLNDYCEDAYDGVCDTVGDSPLCATGTDCFDCDPCVSIISDAINASIYDSNELCEICAAAGCQYCTYPDTLSGSIVVFCSSPSIALTLPDLCTSVGGSAYTDTCDGTGETPAPSPKNTNITLSTCDYSNDSCPRSQDNVCQAYSANAFSAYCPENSDCLDCDPCQKLRFDGCDTCVAAGCYWCASDALCLSTNPTILQNSTQQSKLTCTNSGDFVQTCPAPDSSQIFSDPLYDAQSWVYEQIGVVDVWKSGITGAGVGIRINDGGVDANHIEFKSKFDVQSSCSEYTPVVLDDKHNHGTTCAAIAGGSGNNGACSVGIAPNAIISACRVIIEEPDDILAMEVDDFSYFYANMDNMHISSNSYGIPTCHQHDSALSGLGIGNRRLQQCPFTSTMTSSPCFVTDCASVDWSNPSPSDACEAAITIHCGKSFETDVQACTNFLDLFVKCEFNSLSNAEQNALNKGVVEGRNGKGIVYVFAAGNDFDSGADVNFAGYQNSRFVITVGAADKSGKHSSYSTSGAALFISAPGGDHDYYTNNVVPLAGGGCIDAGVGTSFAAPVVAGVAALMLEANTNLSWRDVQGVLATTATQIQATDPSWTTNSAGLHHSDIYGFGLVNASAAVERSKTWTLLTPEIEIITDAEQVNLAIPEYPNDAVTSTISVIANNTFKIETVIVYLDLLHSSRGDLNIALTSPSGTKSILSPGQRPENSQNTERWKMMTVRNRDESASGDWILSMVDQSLGDLSSCVDTLGWTTYLGYNNEEWSCDDFADLNVCAEGAAGPLFSTRFPDAIGLSDLSLAGTDGLTPDIACCACGGGLSASNLTDTLRSWRLVIYGNDPESISVPAPTGTTSPIATFPIGSSPSPTVTFPTSTFPTSTSPLPSVAFPISTSPISKPQAATSPTGTFPSGTFPTVTSPIAASQNAAYAVSQSPLMPTNTATAPATAPTNDGGATSGIQYSTSEAHRFRVISLGVLMFTFFL